MCPSTCTSQFDNVRIWRYHTVRCIQCLCTISACLVSLQVPSLDDEYGQEAALLLSEFAGGGVPLTAIIKQRERPAGRGKEAAASVGRLHLLLCKHQQTVTLDSVNARLLSAGLARVQKPHGKVMLACKRACRGVRLGDERWHGNARMHIHSRCAPHFVEDASRLCSASCNTCHAAYTQLRRPAQQGLWSVTARRSQRRRVAVRCYAACRAPV